MNVLYNFYWWRLFPPLICFVSSSSLVVLGFFLSPSSTRWNLGGFATKIDTQVNNDDADGEKETTLKSCQVLVASSKDDDDSWFDTACVAYPVVIPPWKSNCSVWKMFYYGRGTTWKQQPEHTPGKVIPPLLPTGWVGLAESLDGIHWTKIRGTEEYGSVLAPSSNPLDFDSVHIGHGDVVIVSDDCWYMYYFGADAEPLVVDPKKNQEIVGFRMQIGRAISRDQGRTWEKLGMVLDLDPTEGWFASWPRVILPKNSTHHQNEDEKEDQPWKMIYHVFDGVHWRVYGACSTDQGETWIRRGLILSGSEEHVTAWDSKGIGTRSIIPYNGDDDGGGGYLMVYEAVDQTMTHRIGTAVVSSYNDITTAGTWQKSPLPILEPGKAPLPEWTNVVVGTPYIVPMQQHDNDENSNKSLWLYFVARGNATIEDTKHAIGLVISKTGALDQWAPPVEP